MKASLRLLTAISSLAIFGLVQTQTVHSASFGLAEASRSRPDYRTLAGINWHWGNTNSPVFRRIETLRQQLTPAGLQRVVKGGTFNAALTTDWTVLTWGQNDVGQLGIGTACPTCGSDVPVSVLLDTEYGPFPNPDPNYHMPVPQLSDVVEVAAGYEHAIALRSWGDVFFWGSSGFYPFTHTYARVPNGVDPVDIAHIAAGGYHDLLLGSNGVVHAWGQNGYGQIGNGVTGIVDAPGVTVLNNIAAIAAGKYHSVALDKSGRVWTWGLNDDGQLGDGTTTTRYSPTATQWTRIVAIAAGDRYTIGLRANGSIVNFGQIPGKSLKKVDKAFDVINEVILW